MYDMGKMDDTERSHFIIDKDTQMVYDTRKEVDLIKLEKQANTGLLKKKESLGEKNLATIGNQKAPVAKTKPWGDLWKRKK